MTQWNDLFLRMPLPESWQNGLLFVSFGVHLLFVLLMLGTALLGLLFFLQKCLTGEGGAQLWNKQIVHTHLGLKSLAVVLGVAPLLIVQVRYSHAFFTATGPVFLCLAGHNSAADRRFPADRRLRAQD